MDEIEINGISRDLRHLKAFMVTLPGKGMNGTDLRIAINLGLHTVSESCEIGIHDMLDENGKPRKFCEDRYAFSLGLPALATRMIQQNYYCWESPDRNRNMNYAVIDRPARQVGKPADGEHQVVFFYLYPENGIVADVKLHITSCHPRIVKFSNIKRYHNITTQLRACVFKNKRIP